MNTTTQHRIEQTDKIQAKSKPSRTYPLIMATYLQGSESLYHCITVFMGSAQRAEV
jgi:hypothetical protein